VAHSIQRGVEVARRVIASPLSCERDEVEGWVGVQKTLLRRQDGTRGLLLLFIPNNAVPKYHDAVCTIGWQRLE
jgi:hypothetical protein